MFRQKDLFSDLDVADNKNKSLNYFSRYYIKQ